MNVNRRKPSIAPLFAKRSTAAKLLDMTPAEFQRLVDGGHLPGPVRHDRWDVERLSAIMRGDGPWDDNEFET